jgi:Protein of unknown function (DUF1360)
MLIITLVVAALAVARVTRLLTEDRLTVGYRRWVVKKTGEQSLASYLAHCQWCTSIWVAIPIMPVAVLFPNRWVLMVLAIPAASYITGRLE